MPTKSLYFFANWKMYLSAAESIALAKKMKRVKKMLPKHGVMAVFSSALAFCNVQKELKKNKIPTGAQNAYHVDKGGYTGEVSAQMFKQAGATYALVGHAERRHVFHETNHDVRAKLEAVLAAKLVPVICVGETLEQRNENKTDEVIELQLRSALTDLTWPIKVPLIVAYEPVWAIGTGESCDAIAADAVAKKIEVFCKAIAKEAAVSVLYGGSVKPETAQSYFETGIFSGVLVGGASTKFETFAGIVKKVNS